MNKFRYKLLQLLQQYHAVIAYLFWGVVTTVLNIGVFYLMYQLLRIPYRLSNATAWLLCILVAFFSNKAFVFESKSKAWSVMIREGTLFLVCRLATLLLENRLLYYGIEVLFYPSMLVKIAATFIVVVLNYILSKLLVFRKEKLP